MLVSFVAKFVTFNQKGYTMNYMYYKKKKIKNGNKCRKKFTKNVSNEKYCGYCKILKWLNYESARV